MSKVSTRVATRHAERFVDSDGNGHATLEKAIDLTNRPASSSQSTPAVPKDFTAAIYDAITKAFASRNPTQLFCLCWPGTVLDHDHLAWQPEEAVAGLMPETSLVRTSLILDQYIPPSPITQPDGTRVSDRYGQTLAQLGPMPSTELLELQKIVRDRLKVSVVVDVDGTKKEMTLLDWFSTLQQRWAAAKRAWGEKQQQMIDYYKEQYPLDRRQQWDEYLKWYEINADGYLIGINNAYDRIIAEFPLNAWNDAISILDTSDNAGLMEAKQIFRNAVLPLPHQEGVSYAPATGVPYSWPLELRPSTKFVDYLADPESQEMAIDTAIEQLRQEVFAWMAIIPQVDNDAIQKAAKDFGAAMSGYSAAQKALLDTYSKNSISAVKIFCDAMDSRGTKLSDTSTADQTKVTAEVNQLVDAKNTTLPPPIPPASALTWAQVAEIADKLADGQGALIDKQQGLIQAGTDLANAANLYLQTQANRTNLPWLGGYVSQLEEKLSRLETQRSNSATASNTYFRYLKSQPDAGATNPNLSPEFGSAGFPSNLNSPENARWTELKIDVEQTALSSTESMTTYFSDTQWGVNLFLGSAGGDSSSQGSSFASEFMEQGSKIQIGCLCSKVIINRPWMRPNIFDHTGSMFRTLQKPISPNPMTTADDILGSEQKLKDLLDKNSFPAYPVALLLAKDVCIKVQIKQSETSRLKQMAKSVKSQGGGFFCFSVSNSEATQSESEAMNSYCMAGQMIARAPAPQIIGYWVQLTPADQSRVLGAEQASEISRSIGFAAELRSVHVGATAIKTPPTLEEF